jgi:hypothetical protein
MSPEVGQRQEAEPVDMTPAAIMQRLQLVGQLNDLCRFLQTGQCAKASLRYDNSPTSLLSHRRDVPETRALGLRSHHQRDVLLTVGRDDYPAANFISGTTASVVSSR